MRISNDQRVLLKRALAQLASLLEGVSPQTLTSPTPCSRWSVGDLVDHLVDAPLKFARVVRGEAVNWSEPARRVEGDWAEVFRAGAGELLAAWRSPARSSPLDPDWQFAELSVHTYDLATALDHSTDALDPAIAERGLAYLQANLTPEMRREAFDPEQPAPANADAYQRIAAFAGRRV